MAATAGSGVARQIGERVNCELAAAGGLVKIALIGTILRTIGRVWFSNVHFTRPQFAFPPAGATTGSAFIILG
jgi:hypothetical protein